MTSTQLTVAQAQAKLNSIYKSFSYNYWAQQNLNVVNAKDCIRQLEAIVLSGKTGYINGPAADVHAALT